MAMNYNRPFNNDRVNRRGLRTGVPDLAPMGSPQANAASLPAPQWAYGMGSEAGLVMPPFVRRAAMPDVRDRDRTQRDEPSPQRRIGASFAAVDPMRGQGLPTETGAMPLDILENARLGQAGFPAPQGAPGAPVMGPPLPRPAPSPQPGAPMNILSDEAQRAAAFAEAGPLTFLERNGYLQRDPETGAYLNPELAAMAEQLMRSE